MSDQVDVDERWAAALRSLSFADQEVLALTAWDGLNAKDAAAALECSRSAYAMRLSRARRRLRGTDRTSDGNCPAAQWAG